MRLVAEHLNIDRGGRRIVDNLSFTVSAGEAVVLTGPNGAGKTTLIRAIAGFLPLAGGRVRLEGLDGQDVGMDDDVAIAEHCHFFGHRDGIKGALTVAENAKFFAQYLSGENWGQPPFSGNVGSAFDRGDEKGGCPQFSLSRLGLSALADVPAAWLSAGQRRRLGLSRLLLAKRPLWLLDEPTVSLDAAAVTTLAGIIAEHLSAGGIVVAATHIPLGLDGARELRLGAPVIDDGAEDAA